MKVKVNYARFVAKLGITAAASLLIMYQVGLISNDEHQRIPLDAVTLGLFVIAVIPWASSFLRSIEAFGVKAHLWKIQNQTHELAVEVALMKEVFEMLLSSFEVDHLKYFDQSGKFEADVRDDSGKINNNFKMELEHLVTLKFVDRESGRGFTSLFAEGAKKRNVKEHFHITERGRKYLNLARQFGELTKS